MEYKYVSVDELRNWWPSIKPGLEKVKTKSPENWIVEDVYVDCFNQKSMLWVLIEDKRFVGFFILQPLGNTMHIWVGWTLENNQQIVENGIKYIKDLSRQGGMKYLTFSSHRRGWDKRSKQYGFRPRQWICEV
jgi:hypothetical protein